MSRTADAATCIFLVCWAFLMFQGPSFIPPRVLFPNIRIGRIPFYRVAVCLGCQPPWGVWISPGIVTDLQVTEISSPGEKIAALDSGL